MHTGKKLSILCLLAFALITCKKQTLEPGNSVGPTTFYFNGTVNGVAVNLTAGANSYYMYSSYTQAHDSVYSFIGNLQQTGSANNSIQFIINDYKKTAPGAATTIDTSLIPATYSYLNPSGGTSTGYFINFTADPMANDSVLSYNWHFGDGGTSALKNPTHKFLHPGLYNTSLAVAYTGGNASTSDSVGQTFHTSITFTTSIDSVIFSTVVSGGALPYTYAWNFGDSTTGTGNAPHHNYTYPGTHNVTLVTTDNAHNTNTSKTLAISNDTSDYYVNFTTGPKLPDSTNARLALSNITIIYTDGSGNVYSSANVAQSPAGAFQITTLSSYENNISGQTTKMLHVKFNCQLKDAGGQTITITNGDAVIGVAYK